jgi:hypothetical protein
MAATLVETKVIQISAVGGAGVRDDDVLDSSYPTGGEDITAGPRVDGLRVVQGNGRHDGGC